MRIQYFHKETINTKEGELKELFDLNFGKDWRLFISLYFSNEYGKHALHYKNPSEVETERFKNRNFAGRVRAGYYGCCAEIMKVYFSKGKEEAEKLINEDKFRFKWCFKKGTEVQIIISDELYNKHKGIKTVTETMPKEIKPQDMEEIISEINFLEEKVIALEEKLEAAEGVEEENIWEEIKLTRREIKILQSKYEKLNLQIENNAKDWNAKIKKKF